MTEEIIIDGVNVAGCEYYKGKCMEYTHYCQIGCKECTDIGIKLCHYKQTERFKAKITRLEQENKDLKKQIESQKGLITVGGKQQYKYLQKIDELEQEYNTICYNFHLAKKERDELKEALAKKIIIPDYVKMNEQIDELKQENKELKETVKDLNQSIQNCNIQRTKMYKVLEEIREIAKDIIENDVYENSDVKAEKIIRKIDEVLKIDIQKIIKDEKAIYYNISIYKSALEEIRNYCDRIEQGSVIGTQDCLINSIKNIVNYAINEVQNESK